VSRRQRKARARHAPEPDYARRQALVLGLLLVGFALLLGRAFERQVLEHEFLLEQGQRRYLRDLPLPAHRGQILDRHGEPLAVSTPMDDIWADPRHLRPDHPLIPELAGLLDLTPEALRQRLREAAGRGFVYLRHAVRPEISARIAALARRQRISGWLGRERTYRRFYPAGEVTAQVVGLTDTDEHGIAGLEKSYDTLLAGHAGLRRVIRDAQHRILAEVEQVRPARNGRDLRLTLDRRIQFLAYRELKRTVREHRAQGGSAVVLDARNGDILALVNQPAYNPNDRRHLTAKGLRNRAVTDRFEPGSTMKPLVMASALDAGRVRPDTPIDTDPGYLKVGRNLVRDHRNYGLLDATSVLTKSSNVGITRIALEFPPQDLWQTFHRLGLGQVPASGLPGETAGVLPAWQGWGRFEQATHAFGYGLSLSTLQLARAYTAVAGDGRLLPVRLVAGQDAAAPERVFSAATARTLRRMLETVTGPGGTATRAAIPGFRVAGKTGTVKKVVNGRYARRRYQALFVGLVPASDPRLVMAVMIDDPRGKAYYGGLVAAPLFARVMAGALRLLGVAPDALDDAGGRLARAEVSP